ncbi:hypothetical protein PMI07_000421 [Rhizobium sp. CF080]|nr:hypothetical protein PMI07_000421 [Rhizobium sp. CF080]
MLARFGGFCYDSRAEGRGGEWMTRDTDEVASFGNFGTKLLFCCVGCFYWITLTPFVDTSVNPALAKPALWSQLLAYMLFLIVVIYAMTPRVRSVIFRPRLLLAIVFGWLFLTAALSVDPLGAIRRVLIALTVCISASAFLMLPKGESQFARLAGGGMILIVGLCYFGVLFLPRLAVHQLTDFLEPQHAGLWKGIYVQKNETGVVMALSCFVGIYLMSAWSRVIGLLLIAASCLFLLKTGAKTSTAMLPGIFLLSIFFERWRWIRIPVVFGGVGLLNLATVGVSTIAPLREIVAATGIDTTYTARADIWRLALDAIAQQPITGYGFGSFWGAESLVNSDMRTLNWAVRAVDAHNAYVDAAMNAGIPGLILMVIWVLATPLKNLAAIDAARNFTPLTRLFLRIWLFSIFLACLESIFLARSGPIWFTMMVAMFGLGYQARYRIIASRKAEPAYGPAYA